MVIVETLSGIEAFNAYNDHRKVSELTYPHFSNADIHYKPRGDG